MKNRIKIKLKYKHGMMLLFLIAPMLFVSCATKMTTRATRVRMVPVTYIDEVENQCQFLGNVAGSAFVVGTLYEFMDFVAWPHHIGSMLRGQDPRPTPTWGIFEKAGHNNSINELLENAAEIGATHVFVNRGHNYDLRGEAFRCMFCDTIEGPDTAYCLLQGGKKDVGFCIGEDNEAIGIEQCKGAIGKNKKECIVNCGTWTPKINQTTCESLKGEWVPEADNKRSCELRDGIWIPKATDKVMCIEKGGLWRINDDIMKNLSVTPTK